MLIVLDNAATPQQVRPLLPGSPGCQVVVTSRSSLSGLVIREGAQRITLDTLAPEEALTLLREIIGPSRIDAEPQVATELARFCAFLPLALRIAGERAVSSHTALADLVCELADEHDRLQVLATEDETTTVRTVFSWSYRRLDPDHARAFRLLGLHTGPDISTPAAAALIGVPLPRARQLLDALSNAHLIEPVSPDRYRFHDLLRLYASERAHADESDQDRHTAIWRVLTWYLHTADATDRVLLPHRERITLELPETSLQYRSFSSHTRALDWCEDERANLVAAIRQADQTGHHAIAWKLPVVLWGFFTLRKHWPEWITTHCIGLAAAKRSNDQFGEAYILTSIANAYQDLHRFEEAIDSAQQALAIFGQAGDLWGQGWALRSIGESSRKLRRFEEAINSSQHALDAFRQIGDQWGQGWSLHNLGETCRNLRQFEEAIDYLQQALDIRRRIRDRQGEAFTLNALGAALYDANQVDRARDSWRCALAILDDLGDSLSVSVRARLEELDRPRAQWRPGCA